MTQPAFAPSLHKAREAGIKIHHAEYPVGVDGIHMSLDQMALRMREGRLDPAVRGWAGDVLIAAGKPQSVQGQVQALLEEVRNVTVYAHDPVGSEYIAGAAATLCLRPGLCIKASDCDDLAVALGSAIMSIGIPVMICKQTYGAGDQEHVLIVFQDEMGNWLPADPTHPTWPAGQMAPATRNDYVDPMSPNLAGVAGLPEADFVGVGSAKVREILGLGSSCGDTCCSVAAGGAPCADCHPGLGEIYPGGTHDPALAPPAPAYTYDQASTDLQNQVAAVITAGDSYLAAGEVANAISSYQAAGNAGATVVGPEIDLAGQPNLTQGWTQWAWALNGQLAAISATSTSTTDGTNAQNIAKQMLTIYQDAIGVATGSNSVLQIPPQVITGTPAAHNVSAVQGAAMAVAAGALAGLTLSYMKSRNIGNRWTGHRPKRRR